MFSGSARQKAKFNVLGVESQSHRVFGSANQRYLTSTPVVFQLCSENEDEERCDKASSGKNRNLYEQPR